MPAHIHDLAHERVAGMRWMQRLYLRVLSAIEIIDIVALNRLIQERQAQGQHQQRDDEPIPAQSSRCITRACLGFPTTRNVQPTTLMLWPSRPASPPSAPSFPASSAA